MVNKPALARTLNVRISAEQDQALKSTSSKTGVDAPDLVREMIDALGEGRLRIIKRKNQLMTIKGVHTDA